VLRDTALASINELFINDKVIFALNFSSLKSFSLSRFRCLPLESHPAISKFNNEEVPDMLECCVVQHGLWDYTASLFKQV